MMAIIPNNQLRFAYFGTPEFASIILEELFVKGFAPSLIVTQPDKPRGRKLVLTPSEVKAWGEAHGAHVLTPMKMRDEDFLSVLRAANCELFIVAAYGKILPKEVLDMPKYGVLNVHPSLLPKFRGSSPIESAILSDEKWTGVTIIELDEEMDHGPVIAQRERIIPHWPPRGSELTRDLAHFGGSLLADVIPEWLNGLHAFPQDHARATTTKKISKEDGLLQLDANLARYCKSPAIGGNTKVWTDEVSEKAYDSMSSRPAEGTPSSAPSDELLYKKIRAYDEWPGTYFFVQKNGKEIRVKVTDAKLEEGKLVITKVIPEGKKEMAYEDFLRGSH